MPENYSKIMERRETEFVDRRKKKDFIARAVPIFAGIAWVITAIMLLLLQRARPQGDDMFTRLLSSETLQSSWNTGLLRISLFLLIMVFCVCLSGFIFNLTRHRRKSDKYNKSIIILGIFSLVAIGLFLWQFGALL